MQPRAKIKQNYTPEEYLKLGCAADVLWLEEIGLELVLERLYDRVEVKPQSDEEDEK